MAEDTEKTEATPEEGVDWQSANDFFNGKTPEDGEDNAADTETSAAEEESPKLVEVSIRGRKVLMSPEAADAHRDYMREVRERDGRLGGEIAQLRERSAKLEGALDTISKGRTREDDLRPPPAKLAVEDFEEYHRQMITYNEALMAKGQAELVDRYERETQTRETQTAEQRRATTWAQKFYAKNPELNNPRLRSVISDIYREHQSDIEYLPDEDGHALLADLVETELVTIRQNGKTNPTSKRPPRLEGAARGGARPAKEERTTPLTTSSWVARERARHRGQKVA